MTKKTWQEAWEESIQLGCGSIIVSLLFIFLSILNNDPIGLILIPFLILIFISKLLYEKGGTYLMLGWVVIFVGLTLSIIFVSKVVIIPLVRAVLDEHLLEKLVDLLKQL